MTENNFISREYHDAAISEIRALIENSIERQETIAANSRADNEKRFAEIREQILNSDARHERDIAVLSTELHGMQKYIDARISKIEIVFISVSFIIALFAFFK